MLDPGRYFAEAIYFLQYTLAQLLWAVDRSLLSIAVLVEGVNSWLTENAGYFVQLLVNALSAPLGGLFILALVALGAWYALNNLVPTGRWVDPGRLVTYGLVAFLFFSTPVMIIERLEALRAGIQAGVQPELLEGAAGDLFAPGMDGTDTGLPAAIPDVNSDGVVGSFDLVAAFLLVANLNELDSSEFPVAFEAAYFPYGDPSTIDLSDEADQEEAKALAADGIERLVFALVAIPTAVAEHFLRLALTGAAVFLYLGVPFAMLLAFFVYTQAFLLAYLRQFVNLLVETLMSVIITAVLMTLLLAAAGQGIGLYIGASLLVLIVLLWRIQSALRLAAAAFNLFGGGLLTGGAGGMELATMGKQAAMGAAGVAGAALTGGATLALGTAALATAAALKIDERTDGAYLGADPEKNDGRVSQLKTIAGYSLGKSETMRRVIEGAHEVRTLSRNFRDGEEQAHAPDILDYMRVGASMSGVGSSPWLAMRLSPSLRAAYNQIGGRTYDYSGHPLDHPEELGGPASRLGSGRPWGATGELSQRLAGLEAAIVSLREALTDPGMAGATSSERPPAEPDGRPMTPAHPGVIHLEPYSATRQKATNYLLERLQEGPLSINGQSAQQALTMFVGEDNARQLAAAVQHPGPGVVGVQQAAESIATLASRYQAEGQNSDDILAAFKQGEALAAVRQETATPLSDSQLTAVADLVLLPQRSVSRRELARVIAVQVAAGQTSEADVAGALGVPAGFGRQTGAVRGVLAGAQALHLSPAQVAGLADEVNAGRRQAAVANLVGQGYRADLAQDLVADLAALPEVMVVPQSTAPVTSSMTTEEVTGAGEPSET